MTIEEFTEEVRQHTCNAVNIAMLTGKLAKDSHYMFVFGRGKVGVKIWRETVDGTILDMAVYDPKEVIVGAGAFPVITGKSDYV